MPQIVGRREPLLPAEDDRRDEPYCLFLDELNACSHEVQKAFYSLIHERRIGEYELPAGSVVIGAGNRAQDSAIVKPMSLGAGQPDDPRPAPGLAPRLAGVGGQPAASTRGARLHASTARTTSGAAAEARGALLHAALLAHAIDALLA